MSKIANSTDSQAAQPKEKYLITNWGAYNKALVNCGSITVYFAEDAIASWYDDGPTQRGAQFEYRVHNTQFTHSSRDIGNTF